MKTQVLTGTANSSGALTLTSTILIDGFVEKIVMDYIDGATGADLVFTAENNGVSEPLLTVTNAGTADKVWYPRAPANVTTNAGAITDSSERIFVNGSTFKCVVADGGDATKFKFIIVLSDY
jgi:hypothetical protein